MLLCCQATKLTSSLAADVKVPAALLQSAVRVVAGDQDSDSGSGGYSPYFTIIQLCLVGCMITSWAPASGGHFCRWIVW